MRLSSTTLLGLMFHSEPHERDEGGIKSKGIVVTGAGIGIVLCDDEEGPSRCGNETEEGKKVASSFSPTRRNQPYEHLTF